MRSTKALAGPMKARVQSPVLAVASAATLAAALLAAMSDAQAAPAEADEAYRPLMLYDGSWNVLEAGGRAQHLVNHCARTGLYFACEQIVEGKTAALVVFVPTEKGATGQGYRTAVLLPDGSRPGPWNALVIDGSRWLYSWQSEDNGKTTYWRNTNVFSGHDSIHFAIENSEDGSHWKAVNSGDETRVAAGH